MVSYIIPDHTSRNEHHFCFTCTFEYDINMIVILYIVIFVRATMAFLPPSYLYMNGFILAIGLWSLICPESVDAMMMVKTIFFVSRILEMRVVSSK